jgi:hypothetical protein
VLRVAIFAPSVFVYVLIILSERASVNRFNF